MKIIDAFWEKRNLGVKSCIEVIIEDSDKFESVREQISLLKAEYLVVKVSAYKPEFNFLMGNLGFTFVEGQYNFVIDMSGYEDFIKNLPAVTQRMINAISVKKLVPSEYSVVYDRICEGIFDTDRIYLDPHFSHEIAAKRYIGWITDELERGANIYTAKYKNSDIGFFAVNSARNNVFLSGIYHNFKNKGLGFCTQLKFNQELYKSGIRKLSVFVSTANATQVRSSFAMGYNYASLSYIFVKHCK
jgi:hypothetical protein